MANVYAFLANGLEEVECLAVVDMLRREDISVDLVSITGEQTVKGSHGIQIVTDRLFEETDFTDGDVFFLPGGMPGTKHLGEYQPLTKLLLDACQNGKRIAAICAAPSVLGQLGILKGKKAVCFPGFEKDLSGAEVLTCGVVTDGMITTARGVGYAIDLGLELVRLLHGEKAAKELRDTIQYNYIKMM